MEPTPAQETPKESRTEIPVNGLFIFILIIVLIIFGGLCFIAGYQFGKPATVEKPASMTMLDGTTR